MGERTDYGTLALVSAVAFVAIVFMGLQAGVSSPNMSGMVTVDESYDAPSALTTNAIDALERPVLHRGNGNYDYDGDGRVTLLDSEILARITETKRCPSGTDCDIDDDGDIDLYDLGMLNSQIVRDEQSRLVAAQSETDTRADNAAFSEQAQQSLVNRLSQVASRGY